MVKKPGVKTRFVMLKLILKFIIGVLALPFAYGVTSAFYTNLMLTSELVRNLNYFTGGIICYVILHLLFYKPTYLYVLGHEAVHAGVAWAFGGKIKGFKVSGNGGSVKTDKTNTVIELAPYFIPIYAVVVAVVYFVIASSYAINGAIFMFLIGFTIAFHIISTIEVMKVRQPDIMKSGYFFSIVIVYIINVIVISLIFALIFPGFEIKKFFLDTWCDSKYIYMAAVRQLFF